MLSLVFAAALALGPRPADLVKPGEEANYARWLDGEAHKAAGYFARADCAAATLTPAAFGQARDQAIARVHPGAVLYLERFQVDGCGYARAQGLVVMRDRTAWLAFPTAPGDSRASLELQRQMLPSVILAVKPAVDKDVSCPPLDKARSALVYDTRVTQPPAADGEPWTERWFMAVCDAGYKVDIDFTPASPGEGGRMSVRAHLAPEPATGLKGLGLLGRSHGE